MNPWNIPDDSNLRLPLKEICELLQEANRQGIPTNAIDALRAHDGRWSKISIWRISRNIGLHPPESTEEHSTYPEQAWQTDPGWIVNWTGDPQSRINRVAYLPPVGFEPSVEREHIRAFILKSGFGVTEDDQIVHYAVDGGSRFTRTEDGLWE
jgi:hypothetical protein